MDMNTPEGLAQQNGFLRALKERILPQGLLGQGMAQQASSAIQSRPYQMHVQEMIALGKQPMSPEQFAQMQPRTMY